MITNISVLDEATVWYSIKNREPLVDDDVWGLISIWSSTPVITSRTSAILDCIGCVHQLSLRFADITKEMADYYSYSRLFSENQAKKIIKFVDDLHKKRESIPLIIHCAAGISRSGAVGLWMIKYLSFNEKEFLRENPYIRPNPWVYHVLTTTNTGHI